MCNNVTKGNISKTFFLYEMTHNLWIISYNVIVYYVIINIANEQPIIENLSWAECLYNMTHVSLWFMRLCRIYKRELLEATVAVNQYKDTWTMDWGNFQLNLNDLFLIWNDIKILDPWFPGFSDKCYYKNGSENKEAQSLGHASFCLYKSDLIRKVQLCFLV